ncbi:PD-(D/E)XK nuclease family protein [Haloarcula sp. CGMCC 1.2071]|uniref:PD-(D/E)XK nuclease family protein n=1 Tax=Haloarcula sp. CGMCC 1.2071 TaxID=3111454 RepID=UPI00300EA641
MIQNLSTLVTEHQSGVGPEVTVRCRVQTNPMPGETQGNKTVYLVEDPNDDISEDVPLSFWMDEPTHLDGVERTADYVLSELEIPTPDELERGDYDPDSAVLQRGEELLVRAIPNRRDGGSLYLNVTSFVIRTPDRLISKAKLRTGDRCPREYYLRYIKRVYPGDKFDTSPGQQAGRFRGDAIHKIAEHALKEHHDRFQDDSWETEEIETYCEEKLDAEFGFRQALLVLSGTGLSAREHIIDTVTQLFTDETFLTRVQAADDIEVEQFLANEYGYAGRVDILLDGTPYDIKTTRNPDDRTIDNHRHQIKLYLFALLLERLEPGTSFRSAIEEVPTGYLIYPNVSAEAVQFEQVILEMCDVREFLSARNDIVDTGGAFAPPSTYNRNCEGCAFGVEEWVSGADDVLPPACTYHCQNERRWPCYETDGGELTTQCSLFDDCDQRTKYRDPTVIDHYESTRVAFREERRARTAAKRIVDRFDEDLLIKAGYLLPELSCTGAQAAGTVIRFTSSTHVVPAFNPGEVVELRQTDDSSSDQVVYYGEIDGEYLFTPVDDSLTVTDYLSSDTTYKALYTFSIDTVEDRYLPYLDFAQRRNEGEKIDTTGLATTDSTVPDSITIDSVTSYLDRERVFVDLPISRTRNEQIGDLVRELVTATYPRLDADGTVPEDGRRALVLGTRPGLVECAAAAQPDTNHFRLDGTGGPAAIQNDDGYHTIQSHLMESRSIVSSVQLATSTNGPGGVREFFHRLEEGAFGDRNHSENFFDILVLLGGEDITEPEYQFLADLADRVVTIGDTRRPGPQLLSTAATDASLGVFFEQEFERYRSFPTDDAVSLQLEGEAPIGLRQFYPDGPWEALDGDLTFLSIEGDEATAVDEITLDVSVPTATGPGRRLVFDVTDTPLSPMKAQQLFENRTELDATALREQAVVVIDNESLFLESKERLEGVNPTEHTVTIRATAAELPQFSRALLSNDIAAQIVAEIAATEDPDLIVTPFERHGTEIRRRLAEADSEVPVYRPEDLDGTVAEHAIVSFATSNSDNIVRPPLDDPSVLYSLLASARDLTIVGNEATLSSRDVFEQLISEAESYRG